MASASGSGLSLGTLFVAIAANVDAALQEFQKFTNDLGKEIDTIQKKFEGLATVGQSFTAIGTALTAAVTLPLVGVGAAAVKVSEQLNTARTSFTTMLGSAQAADSMLKDLQKFAAVTPFEFPELVDAAKRMQALGIAAKDVIPWLTSIGDAAAAMGGGKEVIDGITLALGQMQAKSKVSAQEMNQLAERGIPAWQLLADKIGVSVPEAMKLAEKGAISAATAIPAILAGMNSKFGGSMEALNKTLTGQWSNFKDQITQAIAPIGTALTPVLTSLLGILSPLVQKIGEAANWFNTLPTPVKAFALALAALLAALGPVLLIIGQLAVGIAAIGPALAALGIATTASVAVLLGWAAAIAAAVAALVAFSVWVYNNWDKIVAFMADGLAKVVGAFKLLVDAAAFLTQKIPLVGAAWAEVDAGLGKLQKSLEDSAQKHRELATAAEQSFGKMSDAASKSFGIIDNVLKKLADDQKALAKAQQDSDKLATDLGVSTTAELKKTLEDRRKDLAAWQEDEKKGIRTHQDVAAATQSVIDAEKALAAGSPNLVAAQKAAADAATKHAKELEDLSRKQSDYEKGVRDLPGSIFAFLKSIDDYNQKLADNKKRLEEAQAAQLDQMMAVTQTALEIEKLNPDIAALTANILKLTGAQTALTPQVNATYDALKVLGITAADVYRTAADNASKAYGTILQEGQSSIYQETQARLVWLEAEKQAALAEGEIWSAAQQAEIDGLNKTLDQMEQKTVKHTQKTKTIWEEWSKSVASTVKSFIGDVVTRLFDGSDVNKQLDQQAADLQKSLADKASEYQKSVADIKSQQEQETKNYQDALAKEDNDYQTSLAERTKEYQDYVDSIPGLLADAEKKAADEYQQTTDDLNGQLADRKQDYDRFVEDVGTTIEGIRKKHADELAGELADLQQSLDDRRVEYDRFVEDAATSLSQLREKHSDNIEDETQSVQDNIRDQTKDYTRYAEDTAKKIAQVRAKNNGVYSDEEDDLVTSLKRRQEDLQTYIDDQNRDLAEYKARQQRDQQEEEDALKVSLDRKAQDEEAYQAEIEQKRQTAIQNSQQQQDDEIAAQQLALQRKTQDYETFVGDIQKQQDAAKEKYTTTVEDERLALDKSLADRKTDLETYSTELLAQHEKNRDDINATYEANTKKLNEELATQETDYQTYVNDINAKLATLKADHKTIWDDIGTLGAAAFEKIGIALVELLGEKGLGALAKMLGSLITDVFPSLGAAITKVLGIGTSAAGSAASGAGSAAGGAGSAGSAAGSIAGGALGWANLGVSIVSGVVSFFQTSETNTTLDTIGKHTLQTANDLANLRVDDWSRHAEYAKWKDDILGSLWQIQGNTGTGLTSLQAIELHCANAAGTLADMLNDERTGAPAAASFMDSVLSLLNKSNAKLDVMATGASMTMQLYGTDPSLVAGRIALQMRLQGANA